MSKPEIGVYLPQMGFTYDQILHRARRCWTALRCLPFSR